MERVHAGVARDHTFDIPLKNGEFYVNRYDNLISTGRYNRREWEDVKQLVERELLKMLPRAQEGIFLGTKTNPGAVNQISAEHGISEYTVLKAMNELSPRFIVMYANRTKFIARLI